MLRLPTLLVVIAMLPVFGVPQGPGDYTVPIPYRPGLSGTPGQSFEADVTKSPALQTCLASVATTPVKPNLNTSFKILVTTRAQRVFQLLQYSASASAQDLTGEFASGHGSLYALYRQEEQTKNVYVLLTGRRDFGGDQLTLGETSLRAGLPRDSANFRSQCGTHYVKETTRHAQIYTLLTFDSRDYDLLIQYTSHQDSQGNVGLFSASESADLNATLQNTIKSRKLTLQFESIGIKSIPTADVRVDSENVVQDVFAYYQKSLAALTTDRVEVVTGFLIAPYPGRPYEIAFVDDEVVPARQHYEAALRLRTAAEAGFSGKDPILASLTKVPANSALLERTRRGLNTLLDGLKQYITCMVGAATRCGSRPVFKNASFPFPSYERVRLRPALIKNNGVMPSPDLFEFLRKDSTTAFRERASLGATDTGQFTITAEIEGEGGTPINPTHLSVWFANEQIFKTTVPKDWRHQTLVLESTRSQDILLDGHLDFPASLRRISQARFDNGVRPGPKGTNSFAAFVCLENADGIFFRLGIGGASWQTANFGQPNAKMVLQTDYYYGARDDPGRACR